MFSEEKHRIAPSIHKNFMKEKVLYAHIFTPNYSAYTADSVRGDPISVFYIKHGSQQMHI